MSRFDYDNSSYREERDELMDRIAELEAVAEAAVIVCQLVDEKSSMVYGLLERPLRAAGYLNDTAQTPSSMSRNPSKY